MYALWCLIVETTDMFLIKVAPDSINKEHSTMLRQSLFQLQYAIYNYSEQERQPVVLQ